MNNVYRSVRDDSTEIELLKVDERASTYMVKFLNGDKKGETTIYSKNTMKRWWRKIEVINETNEVFELLASSDSKEQEETVIEEHKLVPMPGIEKLEELKKEYSDNNIYNFISVPSKKGFSLVKLDNKTIAHIYIRKSYILVYLKEKLDSYTYQVKNYKGSFCYLYKVLSESEMYDILNHIKN